MAGNILSYPVNNPKISQGFGKSEIDYSRFGLVGHNGIDFYGTLNQPIMAAADGIVSWVDFEAGGYGNYVMIQHAEGTTIYAHMNLIVCKKGDVVKAGQVIGHMGSTGNSTGVHLHFGYRPAQFDANNGYRGYIDPMPLLIEKPPVAGKSGKVKVVCDIANIRTSAGYNGAVIRQVRKGDVFEATGVRKEDGGLSWREITITMNAWIAERDFENTKIVEDV